MIDLATWETVRAALGEQAEDDIEWAEHLAAPCNAEDFALEIAFVICNSGMKNTVARKIYNKVADRLAAGGSAAEVFGHKGKTAAIDDVWGRRAELLAAYLGAADKLAWLADLPWIGDITKYHLAKNFGLDLAKPDVHLQRLADRHGCTAQALCEDLAEKTGLRVASIDTVLWRACANGVMDSRSGALAVPLVVVGVGA